MNYSKVPKALLNLYITLYLLYADILIYFEDA